MFGWNFIKALKPAKYEYSSVDDNLEISKDGRTHFGVMAQDIEEYLKSVSDEDFAIIEKDENGYMMVNYTELIAPMIATIQQLQERVEELEIQVSNHSSK